MRIWRHHERDDTPTRPAWSADKPVWSDVHIAAPQARELVAAGIVAEAVPEAEVLDRAVAIATEQAGKHRGVLKAHKAMLYGDAITTCGL